MSVPQALFLCVNCTIRDKCMCSVVLPYYITASHCPNTLHLLLPCLLLSADQTSAPCFEKTELLFGKMSCGGGPARLVRKHLHNGKAQWDLKSQLVDTFPHQRAAKRRRTHTHSAYGEKVGKVQEPFASHISCMTAFHHRGQLRQEVGSYICEVLTAKCCRNGAEYFLALLWHRDTKQLHCISGSLLCGNFRCVCAQTSPTCLWLWRDNGPVKTISRHRSFSVLHSITESLSDSENPRTERWLNLKRANCPLCPTCSQYTKR